MPDKFKITTAILAAAVIYNEIVIRRNNKEHEQVQQEKQILANLFAFSQKQADYLSHMLDANEVQVTEFDRIAMRNLM